MWNLKRIRELVKWILDDSYSGSGEPSQFLCKEKSDLLWAKMLNFLGLRKEPKKVDKEVDGGFVLLGKKPEPKQRSNRQS